VSVDFGSANAVVQLSGSVKATAVIDDVRVATNVDVVRLVLVVDMVRVVSVVDVTTVVSSTRTFAPLAVASAESR
jgi:hypothetical protein